MKKLSFGIACGVIALVAIVPAFTSVAIAAPTADPVKVTGELIDTSCGVAKKGDATHAACATSCAKRGEPVAVFGDGKMYIVTGAFTADKNAKLIEFMAKNVVVTGEVTTDADGKMMIDASSIVLVK
ncbi:MAG: hypothetical protein HQ485_15005 [Acidobacteria bacterium]|jgi:hypothetical protein|nr:hypothetical protein [Acidobacteriota bacterium]